MNKLLYILKKYNVEPVIFLYAFSRNLYFPTSVNQLITDKLCLYQYHHNYTFCQNITSDEFKDTYEAKEIISVSVNYMLYGQIILSVPSVLAAIFLGPWLDAYRIAPKLVLLATVFSGLFEACLMLLNVIFFSAPAPWMLLSYILNGLSGGAMICMTCVFTLAMKETPLAERTFRFTIIEFFLVIAAPSANYVGGQLLPLDPWLVEEQTRNFVSLFAISIVCYALCLTQIALVLGEVKEVRSPEDSALKRASIRTSLQPLSAEYLDCELTNKEQALQYVNNAYCNDEDKKDFKPKLDANGNQLNVSDLTSPVPQKHHSLSSQEPLPVLNGKNQSAKQMLKRLFRIRNAVEMYKGFVKRREENAHILLWQTTVIYLTMGMCVNGIPSIMLSFVQLAYNMKTEHFLRVESYGHLALGLISTVLLALFHKIELDDTIAIIVGLVSLFFYNFIRGAFLHPIGLYLSYLLGSIFICAVVSCRGLVSKIIPEREIGTILGALSVIAASTPALGTLFYTQTFNLTKSFYPGGAFLAGSVLVAVTLGLSIWLFVRFKKYRAKVAQKSGSFAKNG